MIERHVNLAYYKKEDWPNFLAMVHDKNELHETWREWHIDFLKTKEFLIKKGFKVNAIEVDLTELRNYFMERGQKNTGAIRSQFVQTKPL